MVSRFFQLDCPACDGVFQSFPLQILHDQERPAILLPDFMNGAYIRVIQGRRCLRLPLKTSQCLRVFCDILRQEFQGDKTT